MNKPKGIISAVLGVLMLFSLAGCGKSGTDGSAIVASIGDEVVTYSLYCAAFDSYLEYMTQVGYDPLANEDELESYQEWVLDYILMDIVALYNAKQEGYELTDAQTNDAEEQAEEELKSIYDEYWAMAEEDNKSDPSRTAQEYFDDYIGEMSEYFIGERLNFEQYSERYTDEIKKSFIIDGYKTMVCEEFEVSEEDAAEWYGEQFDSDRECYAEAPEQFKTDMEYFEQYFGVYDDAMPVTYAPEGYSRIMDIKIMPEGSLGEEYEQKSAELDELYDECTLLMFNDALDGTDANSARINELLDEYRSLKTECDALYGEFTAAARAEIDKAYAELEGGADFSDVMMKYTQDTAVIGDENSEGCAAFQTEGKLISLKYSSKNDWSSTVKEIFGMLDVGEYSAVFADDDGSLHIIYHAGDVTPGEIGFDAVRDAVEEVVRLDKSEANWNELLETWMQDPELKINYELIRTVGRDRLENKQN